MDDASDPASESDGPSESVGPPESVSDASAAAAASLPPDSSVLPRPSNLAVWAFVLALLGSVPLLPIIGSVLGFVLGRVAIRQADSRRVRGGRGLAIAAVTISVVTLVVIALAVAAYALAVAYLDI